MSAQETTLSYFPHKDPSKTRSISVCNFPHIIRREDKNIRSENVVLNQNINFVMQKFVLSTFY